MKIIIKTEPKEIAALVVAIQERQNTNNTVKNVDIDFISTRLLKALKKASI